MQLHQLKPKVKKRKIKRIGRGGKRGGYSGRGIKGQKSRAGRKIRPQWRDILKKLPKKRGYRSPSLKEKPAVVNLDIIEKNFKDDEKVSPQTLAEKGIIRKKEAKVKILGNGEITKKIIVENCDISKSAKAKIDKAGGQYALE
jgi:large subunit ribosomal protein L15